MPLATALSKFTGQVVVIKIGGSVLENADLSSKFICDLAILKKEGIHPILVHGGGPMINKKSEEAGKQPQFKFGLRVTDKDVLEIAINVLGTINKDLITQIAAKGIDACGFTAPAIEIGASEFGPAFLAKTKKFLDDSGVEFDLGFVGEIVSCNTVEINKVIDADSIPVIAPVGVDAAGQYYNINADDAALALCQALKAEVFINLTNTPGLLADSKDPASKIGEITESQAKLMLSGSAVSGGMIPKLKSCLSAVSNGVSKVQIIDGRIPNALLKAFENPKDVGTTLMASTPGAQKSMGRHKIFDAPEIV